jgi:S-disulfanyl-L-cysteine oxidoreductase SoxD
MSTADTAIRSLVCAALFALASSAGAALAADTPGLGAKVTEADLATWDLSIGPDGAGLPPGSGTAAQGAAIYVQKCEVCHGKEGGGGVANRLVGGIGTLAGPGEPVRTVGSYWPFATTVFDFTRRAMPWTQPKSLTADETYALTAYILKLNGIIGDNDAMNPDSLPKVKMPNRDGFVSAYPNKH